METEVKESQVAITLVPLVDPTPDILELLHMWYNDPEIAHLSRPNFTESPLEEMTIEQLKESFEPRENRRAFLILVDGRPVGECSIDLAFPHLYGIEAGTAWIGIIIGDKDSRGKGLGAILMGLMEAECVRIGMKRIELGVFEFNGRAKRLYERMGYMPIATIHDFVYWNGRKWADIRMEKRLT